MVCCPPPSYADLGVSARDVIETGFCPPGGVGVDVKTKSSSGVAINVAGSHTLATGSVLAGLETSWASKNGDWNFTKKWGTDNVLQSELSVENCLLEGLKLAVETSLAADTKDKNAKLSGSLCRGNLHLTASTDVTLPLSKPVLTAAAVVGQQGWVLGAMTDIDTATHRLTSANLTLGYRANDVFLMHSHINAYEWMLSTNIDTSKISGNIFQFTNNNLKTGVSFAWDAEADTKQNLTYKLASQYQFHRDGRVAAKVDQDGVVGLGLKFLVAKGISLDLGLSLNAKNIDAGGHQVGLALEFEQ